MEIKQETKIQKRQTSPFNVATNLLAGVLVGVFLGLYLDRTFGLKPLFTITCSIIGVFAAIRMIYMELK